MPRRAKRVKKRVIVPDAKYGSVDVAKFVNKIMLCGKKSTASRIVYGRWSRNLSSCWRRPLRVRHH